MLYKHIIQVEFFLIVGLNVGGGTHVPLPPSQKGGGGGGGHMPPRFLRQWPVSVRYLTSHGVC